MESSQWRLVGQWNAGACEGRLFQWWPSRTYKAQTWPGHWVHWLTKRLSYIRSLLPTPARCLLSFWSHHYLLLKVIHCTKHMVHFLEILWIRHFNYPPLHLRYFVDQYPEFPLLYCLRGRITLSLCKIIIPLVILMPFILTSPGTSLHQSSLSLHPQSITFLWFLPFWLQTCLYIFLS